MFLIFEFLSFVERLPVEMKTRDPIVVILDEAGEFERTPFGSLNLSIDQGSERDDDHG